MQAAVEIYGGGTYVLPLLLSWSVTLTGGVPCDSFYLTCPYGSGMAEAMERAWRMTLTEGEVSLRATVDEYEIAQDSRGRIMTVFGRGLMALLLDNEAEAVEYDAPLLSELLRNHAAPCGLSWQEPAALRGTARYAVASGSSQWKAISGFTNYFGGFTPRITPGGVLQPFPWKDSGRRRVIGANTPLMELRWREKRYGVYSEVLVVDKVRRTAERVKNSRMDRCGGSCRKVVYTPGRSTATAMRYTGTYQIAESEKGARLLTAVLPGRFLTLPGGVVRMERGDIGISGDFYVEETTLEADDQGRKTTLTMRRLEE